MIRANREILVKIVVHVLRMCPVYEYFSYYIEIQRLHWFGCEVQKDQLHLNQVRVITIEDFVALDINHHLSEDNKFKVKGNLLYSKETFVYPRRCERLHILQSPHDFRATDHFEYNKNFLLEIFAWIFGGRKCEKCTKLKQY